MKNIKRVFCTVLTLALIACLCAAPVSAAEDGWKSAYRTAISQNADEYGSVCQLADFNLDGTPELLIGGMPGTGLFSVIQHAYTFRDGAAVEISVPDAYLKLGDSYELYRNDKTGEVHVEGSYTVRSGYSTSATVTANYSFDGSTLSYVSTFVSSTDLGKTTYTVGSDNVSSSEYNLAYNGRHVGWTKALFSAPSVTASQKPSSAEIDELFNGYKSNTSVLAVSSNHGLKVNGSSVSAAAYTIGGNNYFKLRDLAMLLNDTGSKFSVDFNGADNSISLAKGQPYASIGVELGAGDGMNQLGIPTPSSIFVDGKSVSLAGYNVNGSNYFKLRDLGEALNFSVGWDDATRTVSITAAG